MQLLAYILIALAALLVLYTYAGYPLVLKVLRSTRSGSATLRESAEWPNISITVPVYNEVRQIRSLLETMIDLDYPTERRQILIVSDASSDGTDDIVREFADRGIELLRMNERRGKTAVENAARQHLRGEIVVNTDASVRIARGGLKALIACFRDPTIGLASGRDVSITERTSDANAGESGYVGYEMWVRRLESELHGIVGASGCFYAIRADLHRQTLPDWLSRDFAAALTTHEHGYRAVSVDSALCYVPRTASLQREYRRKVRTITRGMATLWYKRAVMNPLADPMFAWMLFSHKICRWTVPWTLVGAAMGLALLAPTAAWAFMLLSTGLVVSAIGALGWALSERGALPRWVAFPASALAGNVAAMHAGLRALRGGRNPIWEPTRREVTAQ